MFFSTTDWLARNAVRDAPATDCSPFRSSRKTRGFSLLCSGEGFESLPTSFKILFALTALYNKYGPLLPVREMDSSMLNSMLPPILYFKRLYLMAASAMILEPAFCSTSFKMSMALMKLPFLEDIFWLPGRRTLPWVMWTVF